MNERDPGVAIRRILVALDASTHSLAALEAAAALAASLEAELRGLFVEDINLLRLAGLPFARELHYPTAGDRPLERASMERQLRALAAQARQALAAVAGRRRVQWSFTVVRGHVAAEVLTAAQETDLLALGKAGRSPTRRVALGSTARAAAMGAPGSVLLWQHGGGLGEPVRVLYDGSPEAQRALAVAAQLAAATKAPLTVLLLADDPDTARRLEGEAAEQLRGLGLPVHDRQWAPARGGDLTQVVRGADRGLLVLAVGSPSLPGEVLAMLLEAIRGSILLVR
jgi:nucleotide-binding universal stress UspA family protein